MPDLIGSTLGRYQVTALVGRGGMATVYKALDPSLDRVVAAKVMHTHLAADPAFVGRFRHEAKAVAALRHPSIVKVFDFGDEDGAYYMVMEFIDGPTLASLLESKAAGVDAQSGPVPAAPYAPATSPGLSTAEILRIFPPLCSAIDYAGSRGMVHRDVKPSNILLTQEGEPVLTDYGIAKIMGATSYTSSGLVMGSAHYMSPEQVQGFPTDYRTDIYSLGVVLFEALAGRVPFDADTTASILAQHLSAPVPSGQLGRPDLPWEIQGIVERALAKEPERRYQKAAEMGAALQSVLGSPRVGATAPTPAAAGQQPTVVVNAVGATRMERAPVVQEAPPEPMWQMPGYGVPKRSRRWQILAAVGAVVVIGGTVAGVLVATSGGTTGASVDSTLPGFTSTSVGGGTVTTGGGGGTPTTVPAGLVAGLVAEGDSLVEDGRFDEGIAKYDEALRADPNSDLALTQLGIVYYLQPDSLSLAEQQLSLATANNPSNANAWAFLGLVKLADAYHQRTGDFSASEQACLTALTIDPDSAVARAFLSRVYAVSNREDEALTAMDEALQAAPDDPWVVESAGWINAVQGDWAASVPHYERAAGYRPKWAAFLSVLAEALRETGSYDEALGYYQTVSQLGQGYEASAYEGTGVTLWSAGDISGAITNLEQAVFVDDTRDYAHWALGAIYDEQGDYEAALPELERAVSLVPNNAGYLEWLGHCLYYLGRYEEARAAIDKSLSLDPSRDGAQQVSADLESLGY